MAEPELLPDESPDIYEELATRFADPDVWLDTPNSLFGMRPRNLLGTPRGVQIIRDMLRGMKHGISS